MLEISRLHKRLNGRTHMRGQLNGRVVYIYIYIIYIYIYIVQTQRAVLEDRQPIYLPGKRRAEICDADTVARKMTTLLNDVGKQICGFR